MARRNTRSRSRSTRRSTASNATYLPSGRLLEDGLALLAGAGMGAAVMYLLDPDSGSNRRHTLAQMPAHGWEHTREMLGTAAESAGDVAGNVADRVSSGVANGSAGLHDRAHRVSDFAHRAWDHARAFVHRPSMASLLPRAQIRHHSRLCDAMMVVGAFSAGIAAMYLLDPSKGRARRTVIRDKATSAAHDASDAMRKTGQHLANKAQGIYAEAKSHLTHPPIADDTLAERIRANLGRVTNNVGDIQVEVFDGRVTLAGAARSEDVEKIVSTVQSLRGVADVENRLNQPISS